jgi:hypothetical protein
MGNLYRHHQKLNGLAPRRSVHALLFLTLPLLLQGCASDGPEPPPQALFSITTEEATNDHKLLYFLTRNVNEKQFMLEGYQDVANKAFASPQDSTVLAVQSLAPATDTEVSVVKPTQGLLAVYFLFTQPGGNWKKLLSPPIADQYDITLPGKNQVVIREHRSLWGRLWPF